MVCARPNIMVNQSSKPSGVKLSDNTKKRGIEGEGGQSVY